MKHGATNHFPGRTADSTSPLGDSLYERIGLLPPAERVSGQRRHDPTVLYRLAIIQRARLRGCTLREIRHLFFGFRDITHAPER
jgi:hypothetical protein